MFNSELTQQNGRNIWGKKENKDSSMEYVARIDSLLSSGKEEKI